MASKLTRLSPGKADLSQLCLVILMGSLLLSLPFVQQVSSTAGYIDHLFISSLYGLCDGAFTQSVGFDL